MPNEPVPAGTGAVGSVTAFRGRPRFRFPRGSTGFATGNALCGGIADPVGLPPSSPGDTEGVEMSMGEPPDTIADGSTPTCPAREPMGRAEKPATFKGS
jgi:hypothetical protein